MAVLIEAISVVFRKKTIDGLFPGGWSAFLEGAPNRTLFSDGNLGCVSFMHPEDVGNYIFYLESLGLDFVRSGVTKDIAVVDQLRGLTVASPWLRFAEVIKDGNSVSACWLASEEPGFVFTRRGWSYEGSLSEKPGFVAKEDVTRKLRFLRSVDGVDVYVDLETGKKVFLGRPEISGISKQELFEKLKAVCGEVLELGSQAEAARLEGDAEKGANILSRLSDGLLPEVEEIVRGAGRNTGFAHFANGLILRVLKEYASAEACFRMADELDPDVPNILLELVLCLGEQGKYAEALPFARRAVEIQPNDPAALGNLSITLFSLDEIAEARQYIEKALEIEPTNQINRAIYSHFVG